MKEINWGFIGCGEVTEKKSGPAFSEVEGSRVVAIMSRHELKARAYAEHHGISRWYTDAQALIDDPDVNAIYIATPPSAHATYAIMAMRAGKPVYVEKPLASTYDDCVRINHVSQVTGVPCFVAYYRRYLPYFQKVKQLVSEGAIGNILPSRGIALASAVQYFRRWLFLRSCPTSVGFAARYVWNYNPCPWLLCQSGRTV